LDILKNNSRYEFEQASFGRDLEILARLLMVRRESLDKTMERFMEKERNIVDNIDKSCADLMLFYIQQK
jgi:hypothetical protein